MQILKPYLALFFVGTFILVAFGCSSKNTSPENESPDNWGDGDSNDDGDEDESNKDNDENQEDNENNDEEETSNAPDEEPSDGSGTPIPENDTDTEIIVEEVNRDPVGFMTDAGLAISPERGVFDSPVEVVVTHPEVQEVYYTLDSSDPLTSPTALLETLPATISINPEDTTNRYLAPGVVLRAAPRADDLAASLVETHTYLFINRVVDLSPDGQSPGGDWPDPVSSSGGTPWDPQPTGGATNGQWIDYGMDPDVTGSPSYRDDIVTALTDIPSVSLVTELDNLFDQRYGIFVNALMKGEDEDPGDFFKNWERPGSVEILFPSGEPPVQANCGIRIRGGYSRNDSNPKHAFKLYFRGHYGDDKLKYPLFGDEGADKFDRFDLRTSGNYSWSFDGSLDMRAKNTMNRDVFSRDLQREMGQPYTRSRYYHLYLDGVYWGLFQSQERAEAAFAKSYFGGQKDEYDVIKSNKINDDEVEIEVADGTEDSWREVWDRCQDGFESDEAYYALEGKGPDGTRDPNMKVHVDIDSLINLMLVAFYTGNFDGPTSSFFDNKRPNNFFAITSRTNLDQGYVFFAHDNEHTLRWEVTYMNLGLEEDRVNIGVEDFGYGIMDVSEFKYFHPQWLHHKLTENENYRIRFAVRAKEVLENGAMTPEVGEALFWERGRQIEMAIIAESARWGDAQASSGFGGGTTMTKNDHWIPAIENITNEFFPERTNIVIDQLARAGLYPE